MKALRPITLLAWGQMAFGIWGIVLAGPPETLAPPPRVAVLPFANYAEAPEAMPLVMSLVRQELERKNVQLVDSQTVADALRAHRVRRTNELDVDQLHALSDELAAYLLVGSLDRCVESNGAGEVALSARLIYAPNASIEWTGTASRHTQDGIRLLELGREGDVKKLARRAVKDLLHDFRFEHPADRRLVERVRLRQGNYYDEKLCERILVLPLVNESSLYNAGGIVQNHLVSALDRFGYVVVEPGCVRGAMLEEGDVSPGRASAELLRICRKELGVNLILTGAVSQFDCASSANMNEIPSVAVEARLIEAVTGHVVWAKTVRAAGDDTNLLFGTGTIYSAASVAGRVANQLVKAIPVRRVRKDEQ